VSHFVVKDLMITVLPTRTGGISAGCDAGCTSACSGCTPCSGGCSPCSDCTKCSLSTPGGLDWINYIVDPPDLIALREQLREALTRVDAREKVLRESMKPTEPRDIEF